MAYDPINPIKQVFNWIKDLVDYGEITSNAYTQTQAMAKAYIVLNKTGVFKEYIKTWKHCPAVEHTWINFKDHFCQGHDELRETEDLTLQNAGYGNTNLIDEIVHHVSNNIQAHLNVIQGPPTAPPPVPEPETPPPEPAVQHVTTNAIVNQLIQQNQEIMRLLVATNSNRNTHRCPCLSTGPRPGQLTHPLPAQINKYCWTHGHCNHYSIDCKSKAPGTPCTTTLTVTTPLPTLATSPSTTYSPVRSEGGKTNTNNTYPSHPCHSTSEGTTAFITTTYKNTTIVSTALSLYIRSFPSTVQPRMRFHQPNHSFCFPESFATCQHHKGSTWFQTRPSPPTTMEK